MATLKIKPECVKWGDKKKTTFNVVAGVADVRKCKKCYKGLNDHFVVTDGLFSCVTVDKEKKDEVLFAGKWQESYEEIILATNVGEETNLPCGCRVRRLTEEELNELTERVYSARWNNPPGFCSEM